MRSTSPTRCLAAHVPSPCGGIDRGGLVPRWNVRVKDQSQAKPKPPQPRRSAQPLGGMTSSNLTLHIVPGDSRVTGTCDCCGKTSMLASGFIHDADGVAQAAYFVHWTADHPDHGANFDLVVGRWGEGVEPLERAGVSLRFLPKKGFMVIDAHERPFAKHQRLFSRGLARADVVGTPLASWVFPCRCCVAERRPHRQNAPGACRLTSRSWSWPASSQGRSWHARREISPTRTPCWKTLMALAPLSALRRHLILKEENCNLRS